jgi:hypothetical protein
MLPELTQDELSAALDAVAAEALAVLQLESPPVDTIQLARALGLAVAWDTSQSGRGRIVRLSGFADREAQGSILLRPDPRRERLQWAVAHEIGEACACQVFDRLLVDPREASPGAREMVANQLAGRILLPREWFGPDGRECDWELFELKRRYPTASHELIARRMLDFPPRVIVTIFDHSRRSFRRGNLTGWLPAMAPLELTAWRNAHETAKLVVEENPTCRVQVWPVHEPEWKREIIRTHWNLDEDWQGFD